MMNSLFTPECELCKLYVEQRKNYGGIVCMKPTGSERPLIYILGQSPGKEEINAGKQFVGKAGQLLRKWLVMSSYGSLMEAIRWNNAVRCMPYEHKVKPSHLKFCRRSVIEDIEKHRAKMLITVGREALLQVLNKTSGSVENFCNYVIPFYRFNCWLVPILHPAKLLRDRKNYNEYNKWMISILTRAKDYLDKDLPKLPTPKIEILYSIDDIRSILNKFKSKRYFAFDFETDSLDYYLPETRIVSMSISDGVETYAFLIYPEILNELRKFFLEASGRKIAHNLKFEMNWIRVKLNADIDDKYEDTMTLCHLLDPRRETHSLKFQAFVRFGVEDYSIDVLKAIDKQEWDKLLYYNALDSFYTYHLWRLYMNMISSQQEELYYTLLLPAIRSLSYSETRGLVLNEDFVVNKLTELKEASEKNRKKILELADINPNSTQQLAKYFFEEKNYKPLKATQKTGRPAVDEETLKYIAEEYKDKVAKAILDYRSAEKMMKTYIVNVVKKSYKNVVYPNYNIDGTTTGRLSSSGGFNSQNFPKRKMLEMRNIFKAPDDFYIVKFDFSQIEFRVAVSLMKSYEIASMIKKGLDVHYHWAEIIFGKNEAEEKRNKVKNSFVFPALYGAGSKTISSGLGIPEKDARKFLDMFFKAYPSIKKWQEDTFSFYNRYGYVETFLGRRRYRPLSWNEVINFPVQSIASDYCLYCYVRLHSFIWKMKLNWWIPLIIHDEINVYVPEKDLIFACKVVKNIMETPDWKFKDFFITPVDTDGSYGKVWGELKPVSELLDKGKI